MSRFEIPYTADAERATASGSPALSSLGEPVDGYAPTFGADLENARLKNENKVLRRALLAIRQGVADAEEYLAGRVRP